MYWIFLCFVLLYSLIYQCFDSKVLAHKLEIELNGLRSAQGNVLLAVFTSEENFAKEKPVHQFSFSKRSIKGNKLFLELGDDLKELGISILDDENGNGKMDYNFFGMPTEGFGFSNYFHQGLERPKFAYFKIRALDWLKRKLAIAMKYF